MDSLNVLKESGDVEGMTFLSSKAIDEFPSIWDFYEFRGQLAYDVGQYEYAINDFQEAIKHSNDNFIRAGLYNKLGASLLKVRELEKAKKAFVKALNIDSTLIMAMSNLANTHDELGETYLAIDLYEKLLKIDTIKFYLYTNLGFCYQKIEEHKQAIQYFSISIEKDSTDAFAYNNRGYSKLKIKDFSGAIEDITKSIELMPSNSYAYRNRALVYLELKKRKPACMDLNKALELGYEKQYGGDVSKLLEEHCK